MWHIGWSDKNMNYKKSEELYKKALNFMPAGVNSPVRAFNSVNMTPLFIESAKGSKIYDADGNEYIDYICSWGPNILGNACPEVVEAVKKTCESGLTFGACHKGEIELAEIIKRNIPSMEMLRLVNSGTEAVMSAVRVARGYTRRDKILKFEGCYHGHSDGLLVKAGSGLLTNAIPESAGIPEDYIKNTLLAEYNNKESVENLFKQYGNEIACVLVEPCAANMGVVPPVDDFLPYLRYITEKYNAVLIFDEVITGFRLGGTGGAGKYYGVTPDMTALGKIVGGGMPLAVYGGKRKIMECVAPLGSVYQAGTLSGNPVAVSAGIAVLKILENSPEIYENLEKKSRKLEDAMKSVGLNVNRAGSIMTVFFNDEKVINYNIAKKSDTKKYAEYFKHLLEHNIYTAPSQFEAMFISNAHTDEDIDYTCDIIKNSVIY